MRDDLFWILGYDVYYQDRALESMSFKSEEDWLKKDEEGKERYREMLRNFFVKALRDEGKSSGEIENDLGVHLTIKEYRETRRERVIRLFKELDDNTGKNIARLTGASEASVHWILSNYLKKRKR